MGQWALFFVINQDAQGRMRQAGGQNTSKIFLGKLLTETLGVIVFLVD